jgi:hypothetical protein
LIQDAPAYCISHFKKILDYCDCSGSFNVIANKQFVDSRDQPEQMNFTDRTLLLCLNILPNKKPESSDSMVYFLGLKTQFTRFPTTRRAAER